MSDVNRGANSKVKDVARLRILLVGKGAPSRGGIPTYLESIYTGPVAENNDVTFLNLHHGDVPHGGQLSATNAVRTVRDAVQVWRCSRNQEVVHIHSALAPTVTALRAGLLATVARMRGAAVIMHVHGGRLSAWLGTRRHNAVLKLAMAPVHRIVAVWSEGFDILAPALGEDRVRLLRNGVDVSRFARRNGAKDRLPIVLFVGLLTPRKGVLDLLQASAQLQSEGVEHQLVLVGGIPEEGPAAAAAVSAVAANASNVTMAGTSPPSEMPNIYAEADIFCLPSWWEAMPLALLEAMAASLPVVASDVGDVGAIVENEISGFVVPPQEPDALARALRRLIQSEDLRIRVGAAARRRVETQFSIDQVAMGLNALYCEAVER